VEEDCGWDIHDQDLLRARFLGLDFPFTRPGFLLSFV
jgi:hypothetical protein